MKNILVQTPLKLKQLKFLELITAGILITTFKTGIGID